MIVAILCFAFIVFTFGTVVFLQKHRKNKFEKLKLKTVGINTNGYIVSLDQNETRKLSYSSKKWQYLNSYIVTYWYDHSGSPAQNKYSLEHYLNEGDKATLPKEPDIDLGKVEISNYISKQLFSTLQNQQSIPIIYVPGKAQSAMMLDKDGKLYFPPMHVMAYICLFLCLSSLVMLITFLKTGNTF